ncbi:23S rRNA (guanosine-2'-O-)-methyltransferase RlmB [Marinobacterium zhoushanense]|uniref:23S rRNA (guanosine-2'-O-)-methyltransferase RlmB n=1 Tax=Marinobacterium zhoushanense TaxID=1679163 RepID=A0ABQ1K9L8_9GAMM|nr:23S rRNA (guanosine(2251)-2'-O)-methyltransferase RlmB [Marinobacterium zhoushanense]GGB88986.1 23S rRNA (guanosine-2'-O-)-methyltransferase RlmB [Marinobacterium zhoushanense]
MKADITFGIHAVSALLKQDPGRVRRLLLVQGRLDKRLQSLVSDAEQAGIPIKQVPRAKLDELAQGVHQGVVAETSALQAGNEQDLERLLDGLEGLGKPVLLLVLDGVTDPHNLGACLRTADAAGVQAVIAPRDKSAPLNATAIKVACGAAESVPYIQVTNLARTLQLLQQYGVWITGTAGEADADLYEADLTGPLALVMGAEGKGMRRLTREHCDQLIRIPMAGDVSSLNVSVATGVCLFEIVRRRRTSL